MGSGFWEASGTYPEKLTQVPPNGCHPRNYAYLSRKKQKHRNVVKLTRFYWKTNFVLLRRTFLCLCRCKKPCFNCKIVLKLWESWRICTAGKSSLEPSVTKHAYNLTSGWLPWIVNIYIVIMWCLAFFAFLRFACPGQNKKNKSCA